MIDVAQIMCPTDTRNLARLPRMQAIYEALWRISERHAPETILEIGVRAGYSAYTLVSASEKAIFYGGLDSDDRKHYGGPWLWHAELLLDKLKDERGINWDIQKCDTQTLERLPGAGYDLVHVDGDHTYEGCTHDMIIAWDAVKPGGVMVVDDATYLPGPRKACANFICFASEVYLEESPTGSMVYVKEGGNGI